MKKHIITQTTINDYKNHLIESEKASLTTTKYLHEVRLLMGYLAGEPVSKIKLLHYRDKLLEKHHVRTVNGKLSAINSYLTYAGVNDCKVKLLKVQRKSFIDDDRELTEAEYRRLLTAAKEKKKNRLYHIILTIGATGIRVSELQLITLEAVRNGKAEIRLKGKSRTIILHKDLKKKLTDYVNEQNIRSGHIFCTKSGKPLDRSNICHDMKKLCEAANVNPRKVFPHNLRHLFAKSYYAIEKNLARLADILGHSSVETTRIYIAAGIREHERTLQKMRLIPSCTLFYI